ncbi:hypothetical protein Tfer_0907 [Thermincola ferriacetica]|uniref:Uncharacterized protein n=1 Tax=Thermincola ferriacetica TaxID=281456 RepID=A0A0L6W441_9FIRM|nr:hypothetical protein [Thermincola ferriacetica]KNZ70347.1 hypothetical protein Tfer_0907 [Thermincola ferriacetica]
MQEAKQLQHQPDEYEVLIKLKAELEEYRETCGQLEYLKTQLDGLKKEVSQLKKQKTELVYDLIDITQAKKKLADDDPAILFMRLLRKAVKPLWEAKAEMEYYLTRMGELTPRQAQEIEKNRDFLKSLVDMLNQKLN